MHGKEIPDFESLFLATKQQYVDSGIDIHYQTEVTAIDTAAHTVTVEGQDPVPLGHPGDRHRLQLRRPGDPGR